jgi:hypothetical protein
MNQNTDPHLCDRIVGPVFRIPHVLLRIQIRGSVPLDYRFRYGCFREFHDAKKLPVLTEGTFTVHKTSKKANY